MNVAVWLYLSWEIDQHAIDLITAWYPQVRHMGDFRDTAYREVLDMLEQEGLPPDALIIGGGGPPCKDHSRTRGRYARGAAGPEGAKQPEFAQLLRDLREHSRWELRYLLEGVIPADPAQAEIISEILGVQPFVADPVDASPARKPRLWWTNIDWHRASHVRWGEYDSYWRVYLDGPKLELADVDTGGWAFSTAVAEGRRTVPTFLTPAPDEAGRPPPPGALRKCSSGAIARWSESGQQYAPWLYEEDALLWWGDQYTVPWADVKEQLYGFQVGYTAKAGASERVRATFLANTWNGLVVKFLLTVLLAVHATPAWSARFPATCSPIGLGSTGSHALGATQLGRLRSWRQGPPAASCSAML